MLPPPLPPAPLDGGPSPPFAPPKPEPPPVPVGVDPILPSLVDPVLCHRPSIGTPTPRRRWSLHSHLRLWHLRSCWARSGRRRRRRSPSRRKSYCRRRCRSQRPHCRRPHHRQPCAL